MYNRGFTDDEFNISRTSRVGEPEPYRRSPPIKLLSAIKYKIKSE